MSGPSKILLHVIEEVNTCITFVLEFYVDVLSARCVSEQRHIPGSRDVVVAAWKDHGCHFNTPARPIPFSALVPSAFVPARNIVDISDHAIGRGDLPVPTRN